MGEEKRAFDEWMEPYTCGDPYWKVPPRYMDPSRLEKIYDKIERFEKLYKKWTDDLYSGLPTYYGVLCVSKEASADDLKKAYEQKKKCSVYSSELIERAYDALSTEKKRSTYNIVLRLFLKISQVLTPNIKREMIEDHDDWLKQEKEYATWEYIIEKRGAWLELFHRGAPTFYEVLGVDADSVVLEVKSRIERESMSRLEVEIRRILANPQLRFEYDYMLDYIINEALDEDELEEIEDKRALWTGKDDLYLLLLERADDLKRYEKIKDDHGDWEKYTGDKTFYDVLNIDASSIPEDKREAEDIIRDAYRDKERTAEVNLAYSILKNSRLRDDYNWLLKNGEWVSVLHEFDIECDDDAELKAAMGIADALSF
jgi:hypothetical protein